MWPDGVYERQFIEAERGEEPTATWLFYTSTTVLHSTYRERRGATVYRG